MNKPNDTQFSMTTDECLTDTTMNSSPIFAEPISSETFWNTRARTWLARTFAVILSLAVVNITVPAGAMNHLAPDPNAPKPSPVKPREKVAAKTRVLSAKELRLKQGRTGKNPYLAGQNKWDVVYKGINLMTGNFTASGTDLTFEGGYGIPVNVTRSYSANDRDEGPLGEGWTLSVDVRSTAGGLLKSSSAPVRSVPVEFKERPAAQGDPRIPDANEPVEAVIAIDAGGTEETIQKDADGILTTPAWDKNRNVSEYESVVVSGSLYQILKKNIVTTPEGTVYVYEKKGTYPYGTTPWDNPSATATPANVLKITSATDRHGNATTYTYGSTDVSFAKSNGTVSEKRLESIQMPNGHTISFTWGNGTDAPTNRIRTASDGVRTVTYGYTSGLLTSVTTPGGKTTSYGYGSTGSVDSPIDPYAGSATSLLTSITDPRGLTTQIGYYCDSVKIAPYEAWMPGVRAYKILNPNGTSTYVHYQAAACPTDSWFYGISGAYISDATYVDVYGSGANDVIARGAMSFFMTSASGTLTVSCAGNEAISMASTLNGTNSVKVYDALSQNLIEDVTLTGYDQLHDSKSAVYRLEARPFSAQAVRVSNTYNFMGNPLTKTVREKESGPLNLYDESSMPVIHTSAVQYSYWGREKYYQQKAVKDQAGRYSYTDYFDNTAPTGKKGQTYRVYDGKRTTFVLDTGITPPSSTPSGNYWKYQLKPQDASTYSAQFDYDTKGRPVDVWKIQKTTTSPWTYVQTHTEYGADASPIWGAATSVVEDYGSGKINRTTSTLAWSAPWKVVHS